MLVSGAVAGTILGLAVGRDPKRVDRIQIRWLPVLVGAVFVRAVAPSLGDLSLSLEVVAIVATAFVASANLRLTGMLLIATGSALNAAVVLANGGMPVDMAGLVAAGANVRLDGLHHTLSEATILRALGDVLIVPTLGAAYSIGDVAIVVGGFIVPFVALVRR